MRKSTKSSSKSDNKSTVAKVDITEATEKFLFKQVEIVGGKKYPVGTKLICNKVGIKNGFKKPYLMVVDPETNENKFIGIDDAKVIKDLPPAKLAVIKAELEENNSATTLILLDVRNESPDAVEVRYSDWFYNKWIPKIYFEKVCDTPDGMTFFEVTTWKLKKVLGSQGAFDAVVNQRDGWMKQIEEIQNPKPTLIKKADMVKPFLSKRNAK